MSEHARARLIDDPNQKPVAQSTDSVKNAPVDDKDAQLEGQNNNLDPNEDYDDDYDYACDEDDGWEKDGDDNCKSDGK